VPRRILSFFVAGSHVNEEPVVNVIAVVELEL
jgi:hypothetical protein